MPKKLTQEQFLAKAVAVHGGRYDYSQAVYSGGKEKVVIICPTHGKFEQAAISHLTGRGCYHCGVITISAKRSGPRIAQSEFIAKAQAVHGVGTYNYAETFYMGSDSLVKIACPQHGIFEQEARFHLEGHGCSKCAYAQKGQQKLLSAEQFIAKAQAVHGVGTYDYSQVVYRGSRSMVTIICPTHGPFQQQAGRHLLATRAPAGCKRCAYKKMAHNKQLTCEAFIAKAQAVHGVGTYDYSQVVYRGKRGGVIRIKCHTHGVFEQWPQVHLAGSGCQACASNKLRLDWIAVAENRTCCLYFLWLCSDKESFFKVGITSRSISQRYNQKSTLAGYTYEIIAQHTSPDAARIYDWEQSILETFAHLRYTPARHFAGATECFASADEILAIFPL